MKDHYKPTGYNSLAPYFVVNGAARFVALLRDVFATFRRAVEAGCEAIEPPVRKAGDPDTRGMFRDFAGNTWAVGTQGGKDNADDQ